MQSKYDHQHATLTKTVEMEKRRKQKNICKWHRDLLLPFWPAVLKQYHYVNEHLH